MIFQVFMCTCIYLFDATARIVCCLCVFFRLYYIHKKMRVMVLPQLFVFPLSYLHYFCFEIYVHDFFN